MSRAGSALLLCLWGCADDVAQDPTDPGRSDALQDAGDAGATLPWPALALPAVAHPADNPASEEKRLLGRALFYDPILGADRATACVTCHSEIWGLGDQLPRSVGVEGVGRIGPARSGPNMTRRNSPPLWNVALREALFWDGRSQRLEEQVLFPIENPLELGRDRAELVADIAAIPAYVEWFERAFPGENPAVSEANLAKALATFMRAYVSDRATYDQYLAGDERALGAQELRGLALFAELRCHDCHVPPRFDSDRYAARHVPNPEGIDDLGRFEVTGVEADRGAFRVPSLRNARETGPYFHNGAVHSFEEAIAHEVNEQVALTGHAPLSAAQLDDLTQFLRRGLSDTSRHQFPPDTVPSGLPVPLDGDRFLRGGDGS